MFHYNANQHAFCTNSNTTVVVSTNLLVNEVGDVSNFQVARLRWLRSSRRPTRSVTGRATGRQATQSTGSSQALYLQSICLRPLVHSNPLCLSLDFESLLLYVTGRRTIYFLLPLQPRPTTSQESIPRHNDVYAYPADIMVGLGGTSSFGWVCHDGDEEH